MTQSAINFSVGSTRFLEVIPAKGNASLAGERLSKLATLIIGSYLPVTRMKAAQAVLLSTLADWALNEPESVKVLADLVMATRETLADYTGNIHRHVATAVLGAGKAGLVTSCNMVALDEAGEPAVLQAGRDACYCVDRFVKDTNFYQTTTPAAD